MRKLAILNRVVSVGELRIPPNNRLVIGVGGDFEKQLLAMTPLGRIAQPSDIAPIAVFLASDEASWLTGEIILASGGLH